MKRCAVEQTCSKYRYAAFKAKDQSVPLVPMMCYIGCDYSLLPGIIVYVNKSSASNKVMQTCMRRTLHLLFFFIYLLFALSDTNIPGTICLD